MITGEHGIGLRRSAGAPQAAASSRELHLALKRALDPNNILNLEIFGLTLNSDVERHQRPARLMPPNEQPIQRLLRWRDDHLIELTYSRRRRAAK